MSLGQLGKITFRIIQKCTQLKRNIHKIRGGDVSISMTIGWPLVTVCDKLYYVNI